MLSNHPSNTYVIAMRKGERAIYKADYNLAIIQIQTALEVFITRFLEGYYKLDEKLRNILECGYANLIKDHLKKIIDNSYVIKNCIDKYKKDYYPMRNKIVHEGLSYEREDAFKFQEIVSDIIKLITFTMKNVEASDFSKEFNTYNIINRKVNVNSIKEKYK